jgi:hypothetical protein
VSKDKLAEKMNKMENDINMLKEICQIQNASLSMILKEKTSHQRSKSIDYNADNYYSQEKRRTLGKRFWSQGKGSITASKFKHKKSSAFRNGTPDSKLFDNSQSQHFMINKLGMNKNMHEYHSQEKVIDLLIFRCRAFH